MLQIVEMIVIEILPPNAETVILNHSMKMEYN